MNESGDDKAKKREEAGQTRPSQRRPTRPTLTTLVRRRRADQAFFLRVRDAMQQNHKALERLGT